MQKRAANTILEENDDQLIISRAIGPLFRQQLYGTIFATPFVVWFTYVMRINIFAFSVGLFFCVAMLLSWIDLAKQYKLLKQSAYFEVVVMNAVGLMLMPTLQSERSNYDWQDVDKIALTKKLIIISGDSDGKLWNHRYDQMMVFVKLDKKPTMRLYREQVTSTTPSNEYYVTCHFPPGEIDKVEKAICQFSENTFEVARFSEVEFDTYTSKKSERYTV